MKKRAELAADMDAVVRKYVPEWKVISKRRSRIHRFINSFFGFLKKVSGGKVDVDYMGQYWTTLGFTAAYPDGGANDWEVRAHEGKHGRQAKQWTRFLFGYLYLFPQSFLPLVFIILALFFSPWFWLGAVTVLLPLPAPWRAWWELQAYKISVMIETWQWDDEKYLNEYINEIVKYQFAGGSYFFMWPLFTGLIKRSLLKAKETARNWENVVDRDPYIDDIYNVVKAGGRLR
jgi:hypothetical protein